MLVERLRSELGATVGERYHPIRRCGLYIPGGQVPLVSTVLMTALPAKVAGVPELCACTPPGPDGRINPDILAALYLCGVKEVYAVGGVQAIAALALGTKSIPAVDKVFGPGNAFVTEAKRQLFGLVGVDLLPGPSEVMIIADRTANPVFVGADLCAQAEHGSGKEKLYLVCDSAAFADRCLYAAKDSGRDRAVGLLAGPAEGLHPLRALPAVFAEDQLLQGAVVRDDPGRFNRCGDVADATDHRRLTQGGPQHLVLDQLAQALAASMLPPDRLDDLAAGGDADIRHQQDLFERVCGVDVDLACARLGRRATEADDLVEPIEPVLELLRRLLQPLFQFVE